MKVFAIHDDEIDIKNSIGYLFHYERSNSFVIELGSFLIVCILFGVPSTSWLVSAVYLFWEYVKYYHGSKIRAI